MSAFDSTLLTLKEYTRTLKILWCPQATSRLKKGIWKLSPYFQPFFPMFPHFSLPSSDHPSSDLPSSIWTLFAVITRRKNFVNNGRRWRKNRPSVCRRIQRWRQIVVPKHPKRRWRTSTFPSKQRIQRWGRFTMLWRWSAPNGHWGSDKNPPIRKKEWVDMKTAP